MTVGMKKRQMGFGMTPGTREIPYNDDYESALILMEMIHVFFRASFVLNS